MFEGESIDNTITQIEKLYRAVTGRDAPALDAPFAAIPPEKDPQQHVNEQMDKLLQKLETLGRGAPQTFAAKIPWVPALTVWDNRNELVFCIDLPGVPNRAVTVSVRENVLEITGVRAPASPEDCEGYALVWSENPNGNFTRRIPLPHDAQVEKMRAHLNDGVLEIRIPRIGFTVSTKTIPVG